VINGIKSFKTFNAGVQAAGLDPSEENFVVKGSHSKFPPVKMTKSPMRRDNAFSPIEVRNPETQYPSMRKVYKIYEGTRSPN
jgi:hypothetical protein